MARLTVAIPTYNSSKYLVDLFMTLLSQDIDDVNVIISDDCSTDDSDRIIQEFLPKLISKFERVIYYQHKENLGGRGRENYKFIFSHPMPSEYLTIIEGDDFLATYDSLSTRLNYLKSTGLDGVHTDTEHIYEDGSIKAKAWWAENGCHIISPMTLESQIANNRIFTCTLMARTNLYKKAFNCDLFTEKNVFLGDYAATTRLSKIAQIGYIDKPLSVYRWRADSESHRDRDLVIESTGHVASLAISGVLFEDLV